MIKNINVQKIKVTKFALMVSTSMFLSIHTFLPLKATHQQVNEEIGSSVESVLYGNEEKVENYLNNSTHNFFDKMITEREIVSIDRYNIFSLANIIDFKDVNSLEIKNAQLLTDEDINFLNQLDIKNLYLKFSFKDIIKSINNKFDFNKFENKRIIKSINIDDKMYEYQKIVLCNYFINYSDIQCIDLKDSELVNSKLDSIINKLDIKPDDTDFEKIAKNYIFVSRHIEYDPLIRDILSLEDNYDKLNEEDKIFFDTNIKTANELSEKYNLYSISSVTSSNNIIDNGVCINYSNLYSILCIKEGIPMYCISSNRHSWNLYYSDVYEDPVYIDCTILDHDYILVEELEKYLYDPCNSLYKNICSKMFIPSNSNCSYNDTFNIDNYLSKKYIDKNNIIGCNNPFDKKYIALGNIAYTCMMLIVNYTYRLKKLDSLKFDDKEEFIYRKRK